MIRAHSQPTKFHVQFTNGKHVSTSDTTPDKGGGNLGFRPHELLEAALANCMNMSVRMYADQQGIPLSGVTTRVTLDRSRQEETVFEYEVDLQGELTDTDRERLITVAGKCPVRQTRSKHLGFRARLHRPIANHRLNCKEVSHDTAEAWSELHGR